MVLALWVLPAERPLWEPSQAGLFGSAPAGALGKPEVGPWPYAHPPPLINTN